MKKTHLLMLSMGLLMGASLTAMEYKKSLKPIVPPVTKEILLAVQAASQEGGETRKKIIEKLTDHGVDLTGEKKKNMKAYTKLIQLGAIFLGAKGEADTVKEARLQKYKKNSYYQSFFKKYPQLSIALIELAEIKYSKRARSGKLE